MTTSNLSVAHLRRSHVVRYANAINGQCVHIAV